MALSAVATFTSQVRHVPYITNEQFKNSQTPIDWQTLVANGTPQDNEAALTALIGRASTWVDSVCMQVLVATTDTEQKTVSMNKYGQMILTPRYQPATEITDLWIGGTATTLVEFGSLAGCWVEPKRIVVTQGFFPVTSTQGPIQFGTTGGPAGFPNFVRFSYVNGYPVTALSVAANAGDTTITVTNPTGIMPQFTPLRVEDGATREALNVAANGVTGSVITLAQPLQYAHLAGAAVTALPQDVEEAVVLATTAFAKMRANMGLVTSGTSSRSGADPLAANEDLKQAAAILNRGDYIRVSG